MSEITDLSETDASNTSISGANVAENCPFSGLNNAIRNLAGMIKRGYDRLTGHYASTGSANAYVLTPDVALSAYVTGERYSFRANFANTGAATLNISSLGAKTIKRMAPVGKVDLASGDIKSGQPVTVEYDGTDMIVVTSLPGPATRGALVRKSADQAISNTTVTTLTWNTEDQDTDAIHDGSSNTSRLTVPNGVSQVRISCNVQIGPGSGNYRKVSQIKNGSVFAGAGFVSVFPAGNLQSTLLNAVSAIVDVTAGDYFEVQVQQDSGGSLNVIANEFTWFQMEIIR